MHAVSGAGAGDGRPVKDYAGVRLRADGAHRGGPHPGEGCADFLGKVLLGGRSPSLSSVAEHGGAPTVLLMAHPAVGKSAAFEFLRDGKAGMLSYTAVLRYAPAEMPRNALERGLVVQRWVEPYGAGPASRSGCGRAGADQGPGGDARGPDQRGAGDSAAGRARGGGHDARHHGEAVAGRAVGGHRDRRDGGRAREAGVRRPGCSGSGTSSTTPSCATTARCSSPTSCRPECTRSRSWPGRRLPGTTCWSPRAEAMYAPEVFGRSEGSTFQVLDEGSVAARGPPDDRCVERSST